MFSKRGKGKNAIQVAKTAQNGDGEKPYKKRNRFASGAAIIAIGSVAAKVLGALYRVPLTNILGAEGMGIYQLVFPVFSLFIVLSTAGIPTALARVVAEKRAMGAPTKKYFAAAMTALALLGVGCAGILAALAGKIAVWQGNSQTRSGFYIIAPVVAIVAVISGMRGLFQGEMNMLPTALSNMIEQVVKLCAGIALAAILKPRGVVAAACGALFGVAIAEVCALLYLVVAYAVKAKNYVGESARIERGEAANMFKIAFPIAIVALLMPLSSFLDSIILVNALKMGGATSAVATARYGLLAGPVNSLVNMPVVMIMSLAVVIVPSVSASRVTRDIDGVLLKSTLSIRLAYLIGIPCAAFFMVFAPRFLPILYPALQSDQLALAADLLRITAANVTLAATTQIYASLLQALDKAKYAAISLAVAVAIKAALNFVFTIQIGILGGAIASLAMNAIAFLGVNISFKKICGVHLEKNVGINLVLGVIMALTGVAISGLVKNNVLATALGGAACVVVYGWLALLAGLIGKEDIGYLPMSKLLFKLHRVVRFWEYNDET